MTIVATAKANEIFAARDLGVVRQNSRAQHGQRNDGE
jgi:hypothetical protein